MSKFLKKIDYALKHNIVLQKIYIVVFSTFFKFIGLFVKVNPNKVFITANSQGYNDSPKVIYEGMINDPRFDNLEFVWALEPQIDLPHTNTKVIKFNSFQYFIEALSSKVWIASVNIERGLKFKKKDTYFLNTWHGIAINHMGNAVENRSDFDWSKTDAVTISNENEVEIFKRDFLVNEKNFLKVGLPRNDKLYTVDMSKKSRFMEQNNIPQDKKIILYAPTWRDSQDGGLNYDMHIPISWDYWEKQLAGRYHFILRLHPNAELSSDEIDSIPFGTFVYDGKNEDIIELMQISDLLISDYSSSIMDYSITEKPIFSFAYDYEQYKSTRGFYYDLNEILPNGLIKDEKELVYQLINIDISKQRELTQKLKSEHARYGGQATKATLDLLDIWLNEKKDDENER